MHHLLLSIIHDLKDWINPETIIQKGGLWLLIFVIFAETGLFVGFFLPGDSLLFVSGLAVSVGWMTEPLLLVIILVFLAAVVGNFTGYYFGYVTGQRLFRREDSLLFKKKYLEMTQAFYERYGRAAIILGRFLPIIRTFVPILAGAIKLDFKRFALYNILGAALWVPVMIILGSLLGQITWVRENLEVIVIALIVITIIPVIRTYFKERKRHAASQNRP